MRRNKLKSFSPLLALGISIGALATLLWSLSLAGSLSLPARAEGVEGRPAPRPAQIPLPARVVTTVVADVLIANAVEQESIAPGGLLSYGISLDNRSLLDAHTVELTNALPPRTTLVNYYILLGPGQVQPQDSTLVYTGTLPPNGPSPMLADALIIIRVQVDSDAADGTILTNRLAGMVDQAESFELVVTTTVRSLFGPTPTPLPTPTGVLSRVYLPLLLRNYPLGWLRGAGFPADRPAYSLIACGQTVHAGNEHAIYRSEDGGLNWQSVWSGNLDILDLASPDNCATLYAATWGGGVLQSSDGVTWTPLTNGLEDNHWLYAVSTGGGSRTVYAGTATGGVYQSTDAGGSWSPLGATQPFSDVRSLLVGQTLFGDVVQAGTASGLYRWQDDQWQEEPVWQEEPGLEGKKVWSLAVDPHWPLVRYAGIDKAQEGGVFASTIGQAWARLSGSPPDTIHALVINGQTIYAGTRDSGIYVSKDGGKNWQPFNTGLGNQEVRSLVLTENRLIAGTKGGIWWFPLK